MASPSPSHSTAKTSKTHLDALPAELIQHILAYLPPTKPEITPFHTAWPGSRYALLSEPLLYALIQFDGRRSSSLATLLAGFAARPETRFWARVLAVGDYQFHPRAEELDGETEVLLIQHALRRILPAAEAEIVTAPSFLAPGRLWPCPTLWQADRVRVLACLLPHLQQLYMNPPVPGWATGTTADVAYQLQSPAGSPPLAPVLRKVEVVGIIAYSDWYSRDHCLRELVRAFFLPEVRMVYGEGVRRGDAKLSAEPAWEMHGASGVQVLHLSRSGLEGRELEGLLRLPRALREFSYDVEHSPQGETLNLPALAKGLNAQAGSLENLRVVGWMYKDEEEMPKRDRLGSMRGFTKLRELEVEFWMLAGPMCSEKLGRLVEVSSAGLSGLPPGLVRLSLIVGVCTGCEGGLCKLVRGHLGRLFECKGEWVPGLEKLELHVRLIRPGRCMEELECELREMAEEKGAKVEVCVAELEPRGYTET